MISQTAGRFSRNTVVYYNFVTASVQNCNKRFFGSFRIGGMEKSTRCAIIIAFDLSLYIQIHKEAIMPNLTVRKDLLEQIINCKEGALLSELIMQNGGHLAMPCGGAGRCGKCRVTAGGALSALTEAEKNALTAEEQKNGVRLACMTRVLGDAWVHLPKEQGQRILTAGKLPAFDPAPPSRELGAAVDIGTTTVAACLYDFAVGEALGFQSAQNPQAVLGADVITRIEKALAGQAEELASLIRRCIDGLLGALLQQYGKDGRKLTHLVVTGNTTMLYLFAGESVEPLSHAPFCASRLFGEHLSAESLDLRSAPGADVYLPRCISAFVGADITTAILASGLLWEEAPALLLDVGTNGELALRQGGTLYCCSTAAGPALEGANLSCGMVAQPGAISRVRLENGRIAVNTIGGQPARGLCGSGVIDAAAALLDAGILEETGSILEEDHDFLDLIAERDGRPAFRFPGSEVDLSQQDVRCIQLAKGAICAGILTLLEANGLSPASLGRLFLAGGFGNYIDLDSAARIGLLPPTLREKTEVVGNAALSGAIMLLLRPAFIKEAEHYAEEARTIDLSSNPMFNDHYMDCMMF
jgi:uncharacterized 2Fe-2S/4Fe-4S cluster protein (DUF4445 family)